jgi:hypothetical protein
VKYNIEMPDWMMLARRTYTDERHLREQCARAVCPAGAVVCGRMTVAKF